MKNQLVLIVSLSLLSLFAVACTGNQQTNAVAEEETTMVEEAPVVSETPTIVGVAAGNDDFSTLVAAVTAAGLVDVLNGEGPFTVFAPTNAAFAKLPEGKVESLLLPESKETLTAVLTYHVVAGKFMAADVVAAINDNGGTFTIPTVQGGSLTASLSDGNVILTDVAGNASTIVITDVAASNGVIHAIESVVMPS